MTRHEIKCLFLIFVIFIAACIETDIYLPAFPDMMGFFSVSEEKIQSLLTWNFIGICISGPLYGPISDAIGRKKPIMTALGLFLLGSIITMFTDSFSWMLFGRLLQGLGSGGCFTLGTAIIFDAFQGQRAVKALTYLNATVPFIMAAAPLLGGYLNYWFGFRSNFIAIGIFVGISFVICQFFFEESLPKEKRAPFQTKKLLLDFKKALTSVPFWQTTMVVSLIFAGYLVFLSISSVLFVLELKVDKMHFPYYQAAILGAWLVATLLFTRLIDRLGIPKIKLVGTLCIALGGMSVVGFALLAPQNAILVTCGMVLYTFGANWVQSLYFPEGMEIFPDIKGITASLLTSSRLLITSFVVWGTSAMYNGTIYPVAGAIGLVVAIIIPIIVFYERSSGKPSTVPAADRPIVH